MGKQIKWAYISLCIGFLINAGYALIKIVTAFYYRSFWPAAVGIYYIVCGLIRLYLIQSVNRKQSITSTEEQNRHECNVYRRTGWMMLGLALSMTGMIAQMVFQNRSFAYPGALIYLSAFYTAYRFVVAIVSFVKYRKQSSKIFMASKALNLTCAFMAVMALQASMFNYFGTAEIIEISQLMNVMTGIIVSLLAIGISLQIIISPTDQSEKEVKSNFTKYKEEGGTRPWEMY